MDYTKDELEDIIIASCNIVKEKQPMLFMKKHNTICRSVCNLKFWPTIRTGQIFRYEKEIRVFNIYN